eukprot:g4599.t1
MDRPLQFLLLPALIAVATAQTPFVPNVVGNNASASPGGVLGGCSGQIFGFSGLDGPTDEINDFVGVFSDPHSFSLRFCRLPGAPVLAVTPLDNANLSVEAATNDVLAVRVNGASGPLTMAWASANVLTGVKTPAQVSVKLEGASLESGCYALSVDAKKGSALALCTSVDPFGPPIGGSPGVNWQLGFAPSGGTAAAVKLAQDFNPNESPFETAQRRLAPYAAKRGTIIPQVADEWQQLMNKCVSVMRVNGLSAEGGIQQHWSTPDRVPHQWMWLWDSCYHSMSANHLGAGAVAANASMTGPTLAYEYLKSVLDAAGPDGAIAIERTPTSVGTKVTQTQPPLLAWAVRENYEAAVQGGGPPSKEGSGGDEHTVMASPSPAAEAVRRVEAALPALEGYLRWDMAQRGDPTGATPLLVWTRGTESGMDNSQRFDACSTSTSTSSSSSSSSNNNRPCKELLSVDFSVFLAREAAHVAALANITGNATKAEEWAAVAAKVEAAIHAVLYDKDRGLYFDRWASPSLASLASSNSNDGNNRSSRGNNVGGEFSDVEAVTGLLPLWLPNLPAERVAPLLAAINDPARFGTPVPLPSVAARTAHFSTDMWRGPMWLNTNFMVSLGLLSQAARLSAAAAAADGDTTAAAASSDAATVASDAATATATSDACHAAAQKIMQATVSVVRRDYERYGVIFEFYDSLDKDDPRTLLRKGARSGGVRDYHWSAALTLKMLVKLKTLNETAAVSAAV